MNFEVIEILDSVLNSKGRKLKKQNEYMYWSPFVSHHKPKLQVNIETGKWHCWVSNQGGHNLFQLLKREPHCENERSHPLRLQVLDQY